MELEHFNKHFIKTTTKNGSAENILKLFLLDTLELHFEWKI